MEVTWELNPNLVGLFRGLFWRGERREGEITVSETRYNYAKNLKFDK